MATLGEALGDPAALSRTGPRLVSRPASTRVGHGEEGADVAE